MAREEGKYATAESRWAGVGPYYAMFPVSFADHVIRNYSRAGDIVLDPLAGRGTSVYSAFVHGRVGIGVELNPVGWVYARTKLSPAPEESVRRRLVEVHHKSVHYRHQVANLPQFFRVCFSRQVLQFLLAARAGLNWRRNTADRTAMALILINLHGKREDSLSNQMRQTKSMSPAYALRWWGRHSLKPPDVDPLEFLLRRLEWRYAKGRPVGARSYMYLGDSTHILPKLATAVRNARFRKVRLLFTSPPYCGVTNYHYDQWLRLWALGGPPEPKRLEGPCRGRFENREQYVRLIRTVFGKCVALLSSHAAIYVRTDGREFTYRATRDVLRDLFPAWHIISRVRPITNPTQTRLFGTSVRSLPEIDLIASRPQE
jgi:hypothetical protein